MNELEEQILDEYIRHCRVEAESYRMMGKMLNEELVRSRLALCSISDVYIYGGTYLAAQLCRAVKDNANIKGIVDKGSRSVVEVNVPVITCEELEKIYINEKIIITPPIFYREIKADLLRFVQEDNILFLGEFLEGFFHKGRV